MIKNDEQLDRAKKLKADFLSGVGSPEAKARLKSAKDRKLRPARPKKVNLLTEIKHGSKLKSAPILRDRDAIFAALVKQGDNAKKFAETGEAREMTLDDLVAKATEDFNLKIVAAKVSGVLPVVETSAKEAVAPEPSTVDAQTTESSDAAVPAI